MSIVGSMNKRPPLEPPAETPEELSAAQLQARIDDISDKRREERFAWIVVTTILATITLVGGYSSNAMPLVIIVFELPLLFLLAKKMGIEDVAQLLDRILSNLGKSNGG